MTPWIVALFIAALIIVSTLIGSWALCRIAARADARMDAIRDAEKGRGR